MKLKTYLWEKRLSLQAFGDRIGVSKNSVHRYVHGESIPSPDTMTRIVRETEGQVGPADFYADAAIAAPGPLPEGQAA